MFLEGRGRFSLKKYSRKEVGRLSALALLTSLLIPSRAFSQSPSFVPGRYDNLDVHIDGRLDEDIWQKTQPIKDWYRLTPDEGAPPSQKTSAWLVYDNEAIYLAAELQESDPDVVMARSLERDSYSDEQDGIGLMLDTSNDDRTSYGFIVTPAGVRSDIAVSNDADGFQPYNEDWNAFWDASVVNNGHGWSVEMRVPFSSLRFDNKDGGAVMGLILWRYYARNAEFNVFPTIPNKWRNSAYKPSMARDVRFESIRRSNPVYVKPYSLGGLTQNNLLRSDDAGYAFHNNYQREIGLDVKYNLTSNLIIDLSVNTDFAQVEVDDRQINTTRFSLFFPEKRDFFQERAELFTLRFPGGPQRLFQSRRIGVVDGQNVPILGGARLTGRVGKWEVGLIEMQTDDAMVEEEKVPSENFGVFRVRREVFERGSYIGGMLTTRTDFNGQYNLAIAADSDIRVFERVYMRYQLGQVFENGGDASRSRVGAITFQRRIGRGFAFGFSAAHYGPDFRPAVGFFSRPAVNRFGQREQYIWFPGSKSKVQSFTITHRGSNVWGNDTNKSLETFDHRLGLESLFKSSASAEIHFRYRFEKILESFEVGNIAILPDDHRFVTASAKFSSPAGDAFRYEARAEAGGYFGGSRINLAISPSWTLSQHFSFSLDYEFNRIKVATSLFNAHLARLRVRSAFNRALSINALLQFNSEDHSLGANLRLRFNPVEGSDLYFVYTENLNTRRDPSEARLPPLPRTAYRSIVLKYSYTFVR